MPRRPTPKSFQTAHITIRCNNRNYLLGLNNNFNEIVSWINTLPLFYSVRVHHVLFMSNHIHLLLTPSQNNLGHAMSYCLTNLSKFLNQRNESINHIFGTRYSATVIESEKHLLNVIRYIYQNPIRAKICRTVKDYPYSSLPLYSGISNNGLIISPDESTKQFFSLGYDGRKMWMDWLSTIYNTEECNIIRQSLKKSRFRFTRKQFLKIKFCPTISM